jgi:hypothetical protein
MAPKRLPDPPAESEHLSLQSTDKLTEPFLKEVTSISTFLKNTFFKYETISRKITFYE